MPDRYIQPQIIGESELKAQPQPLVELIATTKMVPLDKVRSAGHNTASPVRTTAASPLPESLCTLPCSPYGYLILTSNL
jgi:hypothetical protein